MTAYYGSVIKYVGREQKIPVNFSQRKILWTAITLQQVRADGGSTPVKISTIAKESAHLRSGNALHPANAEGGFQRSPFGKSLPAFFFTRK